MIVLIKLPCVNNTCQRMAARHGLLSCKGSQPVLTKEANPYILGEGDIIKLRVPWETRPRQTAAEGT